MFFKKIKIKVKIIYKIFKKKFFNKRYTDKEINTIQDLDCLVVSGGGSGTTTLIKFLSQYISVNHIGDKDGLKHKYKPHADKEIYKNLKIIFLTRNANETIKSLKNRGEPPKTYFEIHLIRLESSLYQLSHLFKFNIQFKYLLFKQKRNWKKAFHKSKIIFIDYSELFESGEKIIDFLDLDNKLNDIFPRRV
jgi:hypothetical protein